MEYTTLGNTGTTISRLCLGCGSFGSSDWFDWVLDETESRPIIERAIDLGINFFDTANAYSHGDSERILGTVLADYDRDSHVVSTKVFHSMDEENPNAQGLSRKAIEQELDHSLDRLNMETVDLYQIHRWDYETPIEETIRALNDAIRREQVRYLGASSMWAHQFATALYKADMNDLERFVTMQNQYNLVYREEEREMIPFCQTEGVGTLPWSPLAKGYLTRPHAETESTERGRTDEMLHGSSYGKGGGTEINERIEEIAAQKGCSMAQLSLAWLLHKDCVDAPVVGTTSIEQLEQAVEAVDIGLTTGEIEYLEEPYKPRPVIGHD